MIVYNYNCKICKFKGESCDIYCPCCGNWSGVWGDKNEILRLRAQWMAKGAQFIGAKPDNWSKALQLRSLTEDESKEDLETFKNMLWDEEVRLYSICSMIDETVRYIKEVIDQ